MISVALATFNGARYLREQLDSLARQTLKPAELVVSDDGSADGSADIVADFAQSAPFPVRLLRQEARLGFADNFLAAALGAGQPLIAFCDQDDIWLPEKLETAAAALTERGSVLFVHQSLKVDEALQPLGRLDQGLPDRPAIRPLTFDAFDRGYGHCMVFRRELLAVGDLGARPMQPRQSVRLAHDQLVMQLASLFGTTVVSQRELTLYRQHASAAYGAGRAISTPAVDYARPALGDYALRQAFYEELRGFVSTRGAADMAAAIGAVSAKAVRQELSARIDRLAARQLSYTAPGVLGRARAGARAIGSAAQSRSVSLANQVLTAAKDALFGVLLRRGSVR